MALTSNRGERGAALFIVVLIVTLLTAIGTFAIHATSLAQLASGYSRREASAFYIGEFAMNTVASDVADDTRGNVNAGTVGLGAGVNNCRETAALTPLLTVGAPSFCNVKDSAAVQTLADLANSSLTTDTEGFFGAMVRPDAPPEQGETADFRVEITDHAPAPVPVAGMPISGTAETWQDAFTVIARVEPASMGDCTASATQASENQSIRGYVVYTTPN